MQIKFRQAINNPDGSFKEWHYWGFGVGLEDEFTTPHSKYRESPSQQFVGVKDKDGNDIYEGDLLRRHLSYPFEGKVIPYFDEWEVVRHGASFITVKIGEEPNPYSQRFGECVVSGNTTEGIKI